MREDTKKILDLIDFIKIDTSQIVCHFRCSVTNKIVISSVAFEPYNGEVKLTWQDILFHPKKSYQRYYHTPIIIFGKEHQETIVLKAFKQVSNDFIWNQQQEKYIYN